LGGNRVGKARQMRNLLIVWAATGIWHGASWNFLLWGLFYGVLILIEKQFLLRWLDQLPNWVGHVYGLFVIMVGWAIFAIEDFSALGLYLKALFGFGAGWADATFLYELRSYLPMLIAAGVASTPLVAQGWRKLPQRAAQVILPVLLLAGLLWSTAYLVDGTYNPFLYFRF
jgi:alginate O-acetyltransferase complex protein AlgI